MSHNGTYHDGASQYQPTPQEVHELCFIINCQASVSYSLLKSTGGDMQNAVDKFYSRFPDGRETGTRVDWDAVFESPSANTSDRPSDATPAADLLLNDVRNTLTTSQDNSNYISRNSFQANESIQPWRQYPQIREDHWQRMHDMEVPQRTLANSRNPGANRRTEGRQTQSTTRRNVERQVVDITAIPEISRLYVGRRESAPPIPPPLPTAQNYDLSVIRSTGGRSISTSGVQPAIFTLPQSAVSQAGAARGGPGFGDNSSTRVVFVAGGMRSSAGPPLDRNIGMASIPNQPGQNTATRTSLPQGVINIDAASQVHRLDQSQGPSRLPTSRGARAEEYRHSTMSANDRSHDRAIASSGANTTNSLDGDDDVVLIPSSSNRNAAVSARAAPNTAGIRPNINSVSATSAIAATAARTASTAMTAPRRASQNPELQTNQPAPQMQPVTLNRTTGVMRAGRYSSNRVLERTSGQSSERPYPPRHPTRSRLGPSVMNPFERAALASRIDHPFAHSAHHDNLEAMYRAPVEIMFSGGFENAKKAGIQKNKWLIVDLHNASEFQCLVLNRDLWKKKPVVDIILQFFTFMQIDYFSNEGKTYNIYYPSPTPPFPNVAIIDPRTGELLLQLSLAQLQSPESFIDCTNDFMSVYSLSGVTALRDGAGLVCSTTSNNGGLSAGSNSRNRNSAIQTLNPGINYMAAERAAAQNANSKINELTEEEQLQAAIMASIVDASGDLQQPQRQSQSRSHFNCQNASNPTSQKDSENSNFASQSQESTEMNAASSECDSMNSPRTQRILALTPLDDPEPPLGHRIQLRMPDGKRIVRRFNEASTVADVFRFVKKADPSLNDSAFSLYFMNSDLSESLEMTVVEAKLANASLQVSKHD